MFREEPSLRHQSESQTGKGPGEGIAPSVSLGTNLKQTLVPPLTYCEALAIYLVWRDLCKPPG